MKILVSFDEEYPFPHISKLENLINPKNETHDYEGNKWKLTTENDVLKMTWNAFYEIPDEKYEWIMSFYNEFKKIKNYLDDIEDLRLKAGE